MRRLLAGGVMLLLLGAGCASPSSNLLPDEFWAYGSWRFDGDESKINFGVEGVAMVTMHFTRETGNQYLVDGNVTYSDDTLSCAIYPRKTLCPVNTCAVVSTTVGEITGVAVVRDGALVMTPRWVTKPDESVTYTCKDGITTTNSGWAVWQTMGPLGAKVVDETWSVDIADAAFVDDLPTDVATDEKTIMATFDTVANDVTAKGVIGFYRALPASN